MWIIGSTFAFDCRTINTQHTGDWPATLLINWQTKLVSSLFLSGSLDPVGLGHGLVVFVLSFCQTCMIHCHLTRENKAEKWGISGPRGLFLQHSGLHYNVQRGNMTHFLRNLLLADPDHLVVWSAKRQDAKLLYYITYFLTIRFSLYSSQGEVCRLSSGFIVVSPTTHFKNKPLSCIQWSKVLSESVFVDFTSFFLMAQAWW